MTKGSVLLGLLLCLCVASVRSDSYWSYDTNGTIAIAPTTSPIDNYYYFYDYYYGSDLKLTFQSVSMYSGEYISVIFYDSYYNIISNSNLTGYLPTKTVSAQNVYYAYVNVHFSNLNFNWTINYQWTEAPAPTYDYIYNASGTIVPQSTTSPLNSYYYFSAPYGYSYSGIKFTFNSLSLLPGESITVYNWWGDASSSLVANLTGYVYTQVVEADNPTYATVHLDFENLSGYWSFSYTWIESDPVTPCADSYLYDSSGSIYASAGCNYFLSASNSGADQVTITFYGVSLAAGDSIKIYSDWYHYNLVADLTGYVYQSIVVNSTTFASLYADTSSSTGSFYFYYSWSQSTPSCVYYIYDYSGTFYPPASETECVFYFSAPSSYYYTYSSVQFDFSGVYLDGYGDSLQVYSSWDLIYPSYTYTYTVYEPVTLYGTYYAAVKVSFDSSRSYWYFSYSWNTDSGSSSGSGGSSSSSSGGDGGGIVFVIALVAFLLGCILGLLVAVWLATRNGKSKKAQPVDVPLQSQPLLVGVQTEFPQSSPYPYPPMVPSQEQLFNPSVMGLGLPQASYVPSQGMQVPIQMPFYSVFGTPAVVPSTQPQQHAKSAQ